MELKEQLQEFIEMLESDLEMTKKIGGVYNKRVGCILSHNESMQCCIDDLKEILNS